MGSKRSPALALADALYHFRSRIANGSALITRFKGFTYYVYMNVTLSLEDDLVRKVRKIAVDRDTTLTAMIRDYLETVAAEEATSGRKRREREALERTFERCQFKIGKHNWKREDLYAR
jgi:hypothetical protein